MRQILGVPDGSMNHSMLDIPHYTLSPPSSPTRTTIKSPPKRPPTHNSVSVMKVSHPLTERSMTRRPMSHNQSFATLLDQPEVMNHSTGKIFGSASTLNFPQTPMTLVTHSGPVHTTQAAQLIYNGHFSGLESFGASGMTILEELTDLALKVCENGRAVHQKHHSRGAALLTSNGKVYSGCDVYVRVGDPNGITAERGAVLAAIADGAAGFQCLVIATDTMTDYPVPDGQSREFLRNFGVFPIILVNCDLDMA